MHLVCKRSAGPRKKKPGLKVYVEFLDLNKKKRKERKIKKERKKNKSKSQ